MTRETQVASPAPISPPMSRLGSLTFLGSLAFVSAACSLSNVEPLTCTLSASPSVATVPMTVTFRATGTGDVDVSTLDYGVLGSTERLNTPGLPVTRTLNVGAGQSVSIAATGTVSEGSLTIEYTGTGQQNGATQMISGSDTCSQESE